MGSLNPLGALSQHRGANSHRRWELSRTWCPFSLLDLPIYLGPIRLAMILAIALDAHLPLECPPYAPEARLVRVAYPTFLLACKGIPCPPPHKSSLGSSVRIILGAAPSVTPCWWHPSSARRQSCASSLALPASGLPSARARHEPFEASASFARCGSLSLLIAPVAIYAA